MADKALVPASAEQQSDEQGEIPVVVAVHIRPLIPDEVVTGCKPCLSVRDGEPQVFCGHHTFNFDQVYGGGGSSPSRLYRDCVEPLVQGIFNGYNATVLAYGQTGSGKTFTMGSHFSPPERPKGVIPDVLTSMFSRIFSDTESQFSLRVGFIEIHKEEIHDLLLEGNEAQPNITLREMPNGSMCVAGAREIEVDLSRGADASLEFVMSILLRGSMSRATSMTMMNARSSRSHAVFSLMLEQRKGASGAGGDSQEEDGEGPESGEGKEGTDMSYLCAKMLLVDLAGSERAKRTQATGARLQEGIHINQGLLSLANVIHALVDGHKHVPYRNSKLTRLLQDSLGHNSRTVMVACVSPADSNMEETINTLRYANRARNIKNKPIVNRDPTAAEIVLLRQQLAAARAEIEVLRSQMRGSGPIGDSAQATRRNSASNSAAISEALESASHKQLAHALAEQEAAKLAIQTGTDGGRQQLVEQIETYQERILELESQVAIQAKALKAVNDESGGGRRGTYSRQNSVHQEAVNTGHPSNTPFSPSKAPPAAIASPKRPPVVPASTTASTGGGGHPARAQNPQQEALSKRLSSLQSDLKRKEEQIASLTEGKGSTMKVQYEKMVADLLKQQEVLKSKHAEVTKRLEESNMSHNADKIKQTKTYKRQLKELNEQIALMKRRESDKARLEGLMRKSEDLVNRLKSDISRIKSQKTSLEKQITDLQADYDSFRKGKAREIQDLKKDSQRQESKMRRLAMLNQKQKAVLQRKIQEAEEAKKRLQALKIRSTKRTPTSAPGKVPTGSMSSMSGSVSRAASTPIAAVPGGTDSARGSGSNPIAGDADTVAAAVAGAESGNVGVGGTPSTMGGDAGVSGGVSGTAPAPDASGNPPEHKAMEQWIRDEIETVSTAHYTRVVLQGTVAKRSDLNKSAMEHERKIAEIDHLPEDQRQQQAVTRAGLVASKERIESEMEACHQSILALHADLDAAGKQNDEARQDATAARFSSVKDMPHARALLSSLFQVACGLNDQVHSGKAAITDLDDANEILKDRVESNQAEAEDAKAQVEELRAALSSLETRNADLEMRLAAKNAEVMAAVAAASPDNAALRGPSSDGGGSGSPSPERGGRQPNGNSSPGKWTSGGAANGGRGRARSGRASAATRRMVTADGSVGTFDDLSPRNSTADSAGGGVKGPGMPPIKEEVKADAGPDNDALDAQFQQLLAEINSNLGVTSRGQTPEPGPRSSGSGRESSSTMRASDDHGEGSGRFRANPAHLLHPRDTSGSGYGKTRPSTGDSVGVADSEGPFTLAPAAGSGGRRSRGPPPLSGPAAIGSPAGASQDGNRQRWGSWDRLPEARRGDEAPPGAPVGGGGRHGPDASPGEDPLARVNSTGGASSSSSRATSARDTGDERGSGERRTQRTLRFKTSPQQLFAAPAMISRAQQQQSGRGSGDAPAPDGVPSHSSPPAGPPQMPAYPPVPPVTPFAPLPIPGGPSSDHSATRSAEEGPPQVFHNISNSAAISNPRSPSQQDSGSGKRVQSHKIVTSFGRSPETSPSRSALPNYPPAPSHGPITDLTQHVAGGPVSPSYAGAHNGGGLSGGMSGEAPGAAGQGGTWRPDDMQFGFGSLASRQEVLTGVPPPEDDRERAAGGVRRLTLPAQTYDRWKNNGAERVVDGEFQGSAKEMVHEAMLARNRAAKFLVSQNRR